MQLLLDSSQLLPARSHFTFSALCIAQFPANAMLPASRQVVIATTLKTLFINFPQDYCLLKVGWFAYTKFNCGRMVYNSCGFILAGLANFAVQTVTRSFNGVQQYNSRGCFQFDDGCQSADATLGHSLIKVSSDILRRRFYF